MTTKTTNTPNPNEPWVNYQGAMKIKITGVPPIAYSTITVDQSLTVDSGSTAGWYKYPTMWGSNLILENVDPTVTDTEGTESDILVNGTDVFVKHTDIAPNAGDTNWHNVTHKSIKSRWVRPRGRGSLSPLPWQMLISFLLLPPTIGNTVFFRLPLRMQVYRF